MFSCYCASGLFAGLGLRRQIPVNPCEWHEKRGRLDWGREGQSRRHVNRQQPPSTMSDKKWTSKKIPCTTFNKQQKMLQTINIPFVWTVDDGSEEERDMPTGKYRGKRKMSSDFWSFPFVRTLSSWPCLQPFLCSGCVVIASNWWMKGRKSVWASHLMPTTMTPSDRIDVPFPLRLRKAKGGKSFMGTGARPRIRRWKHWFPLDIELLSNRISQLSSNIQRR